MNGLLNDCHSILNQGSLLLRRIPEACYRQPHPDCFHSSIGGHIRHNLDHYWSFLRDFEQGIIDYDARVRDKQLEHNPLMAAEASDEMAQSLLRLDSQEPDQEVLIKMDTGSGVLPEEAQSRSTIKRELQFLLSHTIHHYALITIMCQRQGIQTDKGFGVAPSTLKYHETKAHTRHI